MPLLTSREDDRAATWVLTSAELRCGFWAQVSCSLPCSPLRLESVGGSQHTACHFVRAVFPAFVDSKMAFVPASISWKIQAGRRQSFVATMAEPGHFRRFASVWIAASWRATRVNLACPEPACSLVSHYNSEALHFVRSP
jgi:hypothetical protein